MKIKGEWIMFELGHILTPMDQTHDKSSKCEKGTKKWVDLISIQVGLAKLIWIIDQ